SSTPIAATLKYSLVLSSMGALPSLVYALIMSWPCVTAPVRTRDLAQANERFAYPCTVQGCPQRASVPMPKCNPTRHAALSPRILPKLVPATGAPTLQHGRIRRDRLTPHEARRAPAKKNRPTLGAGRCLLRDRRGQCASGSGRNWMCTARGIEPLPFSISHGARSPLVLHRPRPFQPAFASSMRPSKPLA